MRKLFGIALLVLIAYYVYTSGILSRSVQDPHNANGTPEIFVTVYSPYGTGAKTATLPPAATSPKKVIPVVPAQPTATSLPTATMPPLPASNATPVPAASETPIGTEAPTATEVPPTPLPPTIIIPPPVPTLAAANTPTPSSVFTVTVETPQDGETTRFSPLLVIGQTTPNAVVSANDTVGLANAEGRFSLSVPLEAGPNVLEVIASKSTGEQAYVILTVLYQP